MNFLFPNARVVFIHIPKAAGTAIRIALGKPYAGPVAGRMPAAWRAYPSFAVVRHPATRLLSAVNMFRFGAEDVSENDYYRQPRWPDLTVDRALDILEDETIGYDRKIRADEPNLKHHIWHQSDPFNCLQYAETILRYESLQQGLDAFCGKLGLQIELPVVRHTASQPGALTVKDLTSSQIERMARIYASDFDRLSYDPHSVEESAGASGSVASSLEMMNTLQSRTLQDLWPQYCEDQNVVSHDHPLPETDINLNLLVHEGVKGRPRPTWPGREPDLLQHFRRLEPEFAGRPRIAHLLACTIVTIRRNPKDQRAKVLFGRIIDEHSLDVAPCLTSRWLTSVCDTLVDTADNDLDRVIGLCGSLFSNTVKLAETERNVFYPERPWPPKTRLRKAAFLYDGVIPFSTQSGDAMINLIERVERVLNMQRSSAAFVRELVTRAIDGDTVFSRFAQLSGKELPFAEPQDLKALKAEMRKL